LAQALKLSGDALQAAHVFIDVVTANDSETVLSTEDSELAEIVHEGIINTNELLARLGLELQEALQTVAGLTDEEVALVQEAAGQLPTVSSDDDDDALPGFYL
jgi:predicted ATP-binding protein involved in virulence